MSVHNGEWQEIVVLGSANCVAGAEDENLEA